MTVPAGTYDGAEVKVTGARAVFADAPSTTVTLQLEGDGHSLADFDFKFKPPATVSTSGTTVAVIDFVPVVVKDASGQYQLGHDGEHDESGEANDHDEMEFKGKIATLDVAGSNLTLDSAPGMTVTFANAAIHTAQGTATTSALAVGQAVEVQGSLDKATSTLVATEIEIR